MNSYPPKLRNRFDRPPATDGARKRLSSSRIQSPANSFSWGEVELFISEHLDGKTTLETIRQLVEAQFGGELPLAVLTAFLQNLKKYGFLETADPTENHRAQRGRRAFAAVLYIAGSRFSIPASC